MTPQRMRTDSVLRPKELANMILCSSIPLAHFFMSMVLIVALIFIRRIRVEEAYMMQLFPDQYPGYCARTKALIPAVW